MLACAAPLRGELADGSNAAIEWRHLFWIDDRPEVAISLWACGVEFELIAVDD